MGMVKGLTPLASHYVLKSRKSVPTPARAGGPFRWPFLAAGPLMIGGEFGAKASQARTLTILQRKGETGLRLQPADERLSHRRGRGPESSSYRVIAFHAADPAAATPRQTFLAPPRRPWRIYGNPRRCGFRRCHQSDAEVRLAVRSGCAMDRRTKMSSLEQRVTLSANRRHAGHRSLSAADVNAHGRLAARYDHSSTRGHETGRGHPATFRCPDFRGAAGDHQP
jgi:hypothetical protein